jgi:hypothetical protein
MTMLNLYKFSAYNAQALYGWGCDREAEEYANFLNARREINVYGWEQITDPEEIVFRDGDGVNLQDALIEIENRA